MALARRLNINLDDVVAGDVVRESDVMAYYDSISNRSTPDPIALKIESKRGIAVAVYGAGQGGLTVLETFRLNSEYYVAAFVDDRGTEPLVANIPVLRGNDLGFLKRSGISAIFIAIADGRIRRDIANKSREEGFTIVNAIHPQAFVSQSAKLGVGIHVKAGAIVDSNCVVGDGCIVDNNVTVAHDCVLGNYCHLAPGASLGSNISVGDFSIVGIGASISTGVRLGVRAIVSVGSSVTQDVQANAIVEGVPARNIGTSK